MWGLGKLKDLGKLKELAADMVAPRYEDDDDGIVRRRKKDDDGTTISGRSTPTLAAASNEPTPVRRSADVPPSRSIQGTPAVADASVNALRERIRVLENENAEVKAQTNQYAIEVRKAHEETVAYYTQQLGERDRAIQALQAQATSARKDQPSAAANGRKTEELEIKCQNLQQQLGLIVASETQLRTKLADSEEARARDGKVFEAHLEAAAAAQELAIRELRRELDEEATKLRRENAALATRLQAAEVAAPAGSAAEVPVAVFDGIHEGQQLRLDVADREAKLELLHAVERDLRAEVAVLSADRERLTSQLREALQIGDKKAHLEERLDADDLQQARKELEEHKSLLAAKESCLADLRTQLQTETAARAAEVLSRDEKIARLSEARLADISNCSTVETQLRAEVNEQGALITDLRKTISELNSEHELQRLRTTSDLTHLTEKLAMQSQELQTVRRSFELERSKVEHGQMNIEALTNIKTDLETECHRHRDISQQLHRTCLDALVKSSVQLPSKSPSFSDCVALLSAELQRYASGLRDAQTVQGQWEHTYEQAREVNASLNGQLQEAWKTIGELREELSVKELALARLSQQAKNEANRVQELNSGMSSTAKDLAVLQEERRGLVEQLARLRAASADDAERLQAALAEAEALRQQLEEREDEAATARQAVDNLQHVLEAFQRGKEQEIQQQCAYLQHEVDCMKATMAGLEKLREAHQEEMAAADRKHRKELAAKAAALSSMQTKQQELRRMLEEAASQLHDEHMIDKRVVSHLLCNYIHSVIGQRGDDEDMVRVMSGLLNWDSDMQERAGLIPGPLNPKRKLSTSTRAIVGGLVKTLWGNPGRHNVETATAAAALDATDPHANLQATGPKSVAEMWVDFLVSQGESARIQAEAGKPRAPT